MPAGSAFKMATLLCPAGPHIKKPQLSLFALSSGLSVVVCVCVRLCVCACVKKIIALLRYWTLVLDKSISNKDYNIKLIVPICLFQMCVCVCECNFFSVEK